MNSKLNYQMVSTLRGLKQVLKRCQSPTALDFETTSLAPADGRVRLVSLCDDRVHALVDFDKIKGGFRAVARLFEGKQWVVFYSGFELRWFMDAEAEVKCLDVGHLRRAIRLTQSQLDYAYLDADVTWRLWKKWESRADERQMVGFSMLNNMAEAVIEMEGSGMLLDPKRHRELVTKWAAIKVEKEAAIRALVGPDEVANINSDTQWSDYFARNMDDAFLRAWPRTEKSGQLSMKGDILRKLAGAAPGTPLEEFFDALADYKKISKYISSFGETLITSSALSHDKRIRARFNIGAARTCRFSSSGPNLQQMPRNNELLGEATSVRSSFVAGLGRQLVSLDYSGIELRVLALLADDEQLLEDMVTGDVHAEVASVIAGKQIDKTTKDGKAARTKAKAVSFGIIYGAGATGLSLTMRTSRDKAQDYIDFWQRRYRNAFEYRNKMMDEALRTKYIRCVDGGTIWMGKKPELPQCANYPVQRGALSVMARAIVRHKDTLDAERAAGRQRMTRFLSTIHDALIDEAATKDAQADLALMERDMTEGYLDMFPGAPTDRLVEGGVGVNWGDL